MEGLFYYQKNLFQSNRTYTKNCIFARFFDIMKKIVFFLLVAVVLTSNVLAQSVKWVSTIDGEHQIPVGPCTWVELQKSDLFPEMEAFYFQYAPDRSYLENLVDIMLTYFPEYTLRANLFFGAWDMDSQQLLGELVRYQELLKNDFQFQELVCNLVAEDENFKTLEGVPSMDELPVLFVSLVSKTDEQDIIPIGTVHKVPQFSLEDDIIDMLGKTRKKMNR